MCLFLSCTILLTTWTFILFVLQVVKKSIKLHKMTAYLVENCGLFSWLSSVLSISNKMHLREEESFILRQLVVVLEVNTWTVFPPNFSSSSWSPFFFLLFKCFAVFYEYLLSFKWNLSTIPFIWYRQHAVLMAKI